MRAVRHSPLFRIAVLSLAVLFAHTGRAANVRLAAPVKAPCPGKVAAAQPDSQKKLPLAAKRLVRPSRVAHHAFAGSFDLTAANAASLQFLNSRPQLTMARSTVYIEPQRRPFALRL